MIPKIFWTFWDNEELPELIKKCIDTWKFYNPDYQINILNMKNYKNYIDENIEKFKHFDKSKPQLTADYIRICLLKKYGGVWMDASIVCIKPIKFKDSTIFFCYYIDNYGPFGNNKFPLIENWFIAASTNNLFINEWYDEFINEGNKYNTLIEYVLLSNVQVPINNFRDYFAMHISAQKVLKKLNNSNRYPKDLGFTLRNTYMKEGPFLFSNIKLLLSNSFCNTDFKKIKTSIIKLTNIDRLVLNVNKKNNNCLLKKIENFSGEYSDKFIEDLTETELIDNKHTFNYNIFTKNLIMVIIIPLICVFFIVFIIKYEKNK